VCTFSEQDVSAGVCGVSVGLPLILVPAIYCIRSSGDWSSRMARTRRRTTTTWAAKECIATQIVLLHQVLLPLALHTDADDMCLMTACHARARAKWRICSHSRRQRRWGSEL
jgi:hypothetical protein